MTIARQPVPAQPPVDSPVGRRVWQRPVLRTDEDRELHRGVSTLELFFDLVFVVIISRLAHHLAVHHEPGELVDFAVQFLAVFWVWNGFTFYAERFESDGLENRLLTFAAIVPVAGLAVFADGGLGGGYSGFALTYLLARLVNQLSWARAGLHVPVFRPVSLRFHAGFLTAVGLVAVSLAVDGYVRTAVFAAAVLVEIATPWYTAKQQAALPRLSTSKFPERFGLFTIIILGESIAGVIVGISELRARGVLDASGVVAGVLGLAIGFCLWWIYFDFVARRPPKPVFLTALIWVYLHLVALTGFVATGVGVSLVIADTAGEGLADSSRHLLVAGVILSLLGVAALQTTLARAPDEPTHPRFSPALKVAVAVAVGLMGGLDLGWSIIGLLMALLVGLVIPMAYGAYVWYIRPCPPSPDPAGRGR